MSFYFVIDGKKSGPYYSCPYLDRNLSLEFNFIKYFDIIYKDKNSVNNLYKKKYKYN